MLNGVFARIILGLQQIAPPQSRQCGRTRIPKCRNQPLLTMMTKAQQSISNHRFSPFQLPPVVLSDGSAESSLTATPLPRNLESSLSKNISGFYPTGSETVCAFHRGRNRELQAINTWLLCQFRG
jgi:hypothetical protein